MNAQGDGVSTDDQWLDLGCFDKLVELAIGVQDFYPDLRPAVTRLIPFT